MKKWFSLLWHNQHLWDILAFLSIALFVIVAQEYYLLYHAPLYAWCTWIGIGCLGAEFLWLAYTFQTSWNHRAERKRARNKMRKN